MTREKEHLFTVREPSQTSESHKHLNPGTSADRAWPGPSPPIAGVCPVLVTLWTNHSPYSGYSVLQPHCRHSLSQSPCQFIFMTHGDPLDSTVRGFLQFVYWVLFSSASFNLKKKKGLCVMWMGVYSACKCTICRRWCQSNRN